MAHRSALSPAFKAIRRCQNPDCGAVIPDVTWDRKARAWRSVRGYDERVYCNVRCLNQSCRSGNPEWLRRFHPNYEPPC